MLVTKNWIDDEKWLVGPVNGKYLNAMHLARQVCMIENYDEIVREAYLYAYKHESTNPYIRENAFSARRTSKLLVQSGHLKAATLAERVPLKLWDKTNEAQGRHRQNGRRTQGTIRLSKSKSCSGRGGPRYGVTASVLSGAARFIEVLIHEIIHVIHLSCVHKAAVINNVRRPHCLMFNHILLNTAHEIIGLSDSERDPRFMGYSVGNGYAPSRKLEKIIQKKIDDGDEKVMALFIHNKSEPKPKRPRKETIYRRNAEYVIWLGDDDDCDSDDGIDWRDTQALITYLEANNTNYDKDGNRVALIERRSANWDYDTLWEASE